MKYILFTTTTCPKCPAMKELVLQNVKFEGEILDNTASSFGERVQQAGVQNAPTIVIYDDKDNEVFRASETEELQEWLNNN